VIILSAGKKARQFIGIITEAEVMVEFAVLLT